MLGKVFLGKREVAATEHPLASLAALQAFENGGNAFDAAASASFVLSVVLPHLTGLGGDFFALFYHASKDKVFCLNGSGWSPSSFTVERLVKPGEKRIPMMGHGSVTVPGCVGGVYELQSKFGRLSFSDSLRAAIGIAEEGFAIGPYLVRCLAQFGSSFSPAAKELFLKSGETPKVGSILKQKKLAETLRQVAQGGADGFYKGAAAEAIRSEMASAGFDLDGKDFDYSAEWCEPLKMEYHGTEVYEVPPNSMGATSLLILKMLEDAKLSSVKPNSAERINLMIEAAQTAHAVRDRTIGDPRFSKFDFDSFLASAKGKGTGDKIGKADTSYFSVTDRDGNILSCIQSVFANFGSRVFVEKAGFFMNNRGAAFATEGPNKLEPRKRPIHTLSAMLFARDGKPFIATGTSGGGYRPQLHALFATNMIDYKMSLEEAIDYPRFVWDGWFGLRIEKGYEDLGKVTMEHKVIEYPGENGVGQGVEVMKESVKGVCDIRGEGLPVGS